MLWVVLMLPHWLAHGRGAEAAPLLRTMPVKDDHV